MEDDCSSCPLYRLRLDARALRAFPEIAAAANRVVAASRRPPGFVRDEMVAAISGYCDRVRREFGDGCSLDRIGACRTEVGARLAVRLTTPDADPLRLAVGALRTLAAWDDEGAEQFRYSVLKPIIRRERERAQARPGVLPLVVMESMPDV